VVDKHASVDDQVAVIMQGADLGDSRLKQAMQEALRERLLMRQRQGRPLRVYAGGNVRYFV
jgi:hypothetical protein